MRFPVLAKEDVPDDARGRSTLNGLIGDVPPCCGKHRHGR
jgi:hypothetical protein